MQAFTQYASYRSLWDDPDLQTTIDEGIRRNRQSEGVIQITDYAGKPVEGVTIRAIQHDSAFHFGANIFKLGGYDSDELNRKYEEAYCGLFNGATVPFYWRALEPEQGRPRYQAHSVPISRRPPPDVVVDFCKKRGLRMHGHTLVWRYNKWSIPDWLPRDPARSAPLFENRCREIGERYGHAIKSWDVVNEAVAAATWPDNCHPMAENYEQKAFEWARNYFPADNRFDINETTDGWNVADPRYAQLIRRLIDAKTRIGGIGLQFHLFSDADLEKVLQGGKFPPGELLKALDHYGHLGLPIHVSEITLTSLDNNTEGLDIQAEVARNFYRLWFSHPAVEGISWWNLPDGGASPGENHVHSGLLFDDLTPKPAYAILRHLFRHEWRTQTRGVTDGNGRFRFRGFHGTYRIQTESGKEDSGIESSITLQPGKNSELLIRL